ncbi:hypothetical protein [Zhongshania aliphaticivorans]|uniref:hypothetical protein n=1 Tax=Zhongshania aliphaticivorans TaxID=1470434 RepID=UPI0013309876|nr:hypothetical protein [Zhongshania aliphaticivorans]
MTSSFQCPLKLNKLAYSLIINADMRNFPRLVWRVIKVLVGSLVVLLFRYGLDESLVGDDS